jgi:hypothetical protein
MLPATSGAIPPAARRVARRFGEQAALVVVADRPDRHARVGGELADGEQVQNSSGGMQSSR